MEVVQKTITEYLGKDAAESSDDQSGDNKKMLTKGAMKIFEGLKVSIPTDDLDMSEVLNCNPSVKSQLKSSDKKTKPVKANLDKFGNKLGLKVTKKKHIQNRRSPKSKSTEKILDIYDFEETQDNTDVFSNNITDLKTFRNQSKTVSDLSNQLKQQTNDVKDSFTYEVESLSSFSTESSDTLKKAKPKNITKKKCMIMGRIFKNAFKSKCDEPVQEMPPLDHSKLVEEYVLNCPDKKNSKITDIEMDVLFDRLLEPDQANTGGAVLESLDNKKSAKSLKQKPQKNRKRRNEDSSDDEFNITKGVKKRNTKKNNKVDAGINLEQELKECIGVASRKSQRKCTSGKQNVLVEYWSSDESNFENFLEEFAELTKNPATPDEVAIQPTPLPEPLPSSTPPALPEPPQEEPPDQIVIPEIKEPPPAIIDEETKTDATKPRKLVAPKRRKLITKPTKLKDKQFTKHVSKEINTTDSLVATRKKRNASDTLYYWSSSSDDEYEDLIEIKPIREEEDDEDRPMQHGWIVGDSPKKLVTMLAQAKGKKTETECVKEQGKKRTSV